MKTLKPENEILQDTIDVHQKTIDSLCDQLIRADELAESRLAEIETQAVTIQEHAKEIIARRAEIVELEKTAGAIAADDNAEACHNCGAACANWPLCDNCGVTHTEKETKT